MSEYELPAIDRTSIIDVRQTRDEDGDTWRGIRFPPPAGGSTTDEGEASVRVRRDPDAWLTALSSG